MLPRFAPIVVLTAALVAPAYSQGVDMARLKRAAAMPSISITADFSFSARLVHLGDTRDLLAQITRIDQELKTNPTDSIRWQRLGVLRSERGDTNESREAYQKAVNLLEKALATKPDDSKLQARQGECYSALGRTAEAEAVLRNAVRVSPKEWRAWIALGELLDGKAWKRLSLSQAELDSLKAIKNPAELQVKMTTGFQQKLTPTALSEAKRLSDEARQCYDRAVAAGPQEPEPYLVRASSRMLSDGGVAGLLAALSNDGKTQAGEGVMKRLLAPEVAADLRKARRLAADSPETIAATGAMECFWVVMEKGDALEGMGTEDAWNKLPQASQAPIIEGMLRLTELSISPDKNISAAAFEGLGILAFLRGQQEKMESFLKQAAGLRSLNSRSIDLLSLAYLSSGRMDELAKLYQDRLATEDTPRNRFILAKALQRQGKNDDALVQLTAALKAAPDDFLCNLGAATLKLQGGEIDAAGPYLIKAATQEAAGKLDGQQSADLFVTLGIWQGLRGKTDDAKTTLKKAQSMDKENESITEALAALG
ncbi:MAG: tetratricopeptide repeat protein [Armatimonas sp.]